LRKTTTQGQDGAVFQRIVVWSLGFDRLSLTGGNGIQL
jgi:hypothetical protein